MADELDQHTKARLALEGGRQALSRDNARAAQEAMDAGQLPTSAQVKLEQLVKNYSDALKSAIERKWVIEKAIAYSAATKVEVTVPGFIEVVKFIDGFVRPEEPEKWPP